VDSCLNHANVVDGGCEFGSLASETIWPTQICGTNSPRSSGADGTPRLKRNGPDSDHVAYLLLATFQDETLLSQVDLDAKSLRGPAHSDSMTEISRAPSLHCNIRLASDLASHTLPTWLPPRGLVRGLPPPNASDLPLVNGLARRHRTGR